MYRGGGGRGGGSNLLLTMILRLRDWKGGPWSPELLGGPDLKRGASDPSSYHEYINIEFQNSLRRLVFFVLYNIKSTWINSVPIF